MTEENPRQNALVQGPRKKPYVLSASVPGPYPKLFDPYSCMSDPLVSYGRHFGRTIHALCNVRILVTNGLLRMSELAEPIESPTPE
jgi:hypothetical protein